MDHVRPPAAARPLIAELDRYSTYANTPAPSAPSKPPRRIRPWERGASHAPVDQRQSIGAGHAGPSGIRPAFSSPAESTVPIRFVPEFPPSPPACYNLAISPLPDPT